MITEQNTAIYMLDVDGVMTSPETKKPHPRILAFIANCLFNDRQIAMATARDFAWLEEFVISPIRPYLSPHKMDSLFISAEKAAVAVSFINGQTRKEIDETMLVPDELRGMVKKAITEQDRTGIFNYPKEAIHTIEIYGGEVDEVSMQQAELDEFNVWVQTKLLPQFPNYKADRTAIAIDIYHRTGNKIISAQRFVEFMRRKGLDLDGKSFIAIGDGVPDMEMAIGLCDEKLDTTFAWVGKGDSPRETGIKIITPGTGKEGINDKGTVDLLAYWGEISTLN